MTMKWIIAAFVLFTAGYMLFDGIHALTLGDYVTPAAGEYAGQLGPWAGLVGSLGIDPRSTFMKWIFIVYGLSALAALAGFLTDQTWGRRALLITVMLGLWYLPFGTLSGIIIFFLMWFQSPRRLERTHS